MYDVETRSVLESPELLVFKHLPPRVLTHDRHEVALRIKPRDLLLEVLATVTQ
jgi:hypothetical protein